MEIKNEQVREIYKRWDAIWKSEELTLETRLKAFSILGVVKALVCIYEYDEELDEEDVQDLFISWSKDFKPIMPEERPEFLARLKKQLKNTKNNALDKII